MKYIYTLITCFILFIACSDENSSPTSSDKERKSLISKDSNGTALGNYELNERAWKANHKARLNEEAREIDSAIVEYQLALQLFKLLENDTMVIKTMESLGICYWESQNNKKAIAVFNEQHDWIEKTGNNALLPACYNNLGLVYYTEDDYSNAIKYYSLAISEFRNLEFPEQLATSLLNLGILLKNQGIYEEALQLLFEAERYLWKEGDSRELASCYEAIGLVNHYLKEYDEALYYHHKALEIRRKLEYERGIAKSYNNIGLEFMELGALDSALVYFEKSVKLKENLENSRLLITTIENIGKVYDRKGNTQIAERYYLQGIEICHKNGATKEQASLYHLLSQLKIKEGKTDEAKRLLNKASEKIKKIDSRSLLVENYRLKKELYESSGNYVKALKNANQYIIAKDSLLNIEKNNHIAQLEVLHQVEKKEQENSRLKQDAQLGKLKYYFTLAIAAVLLILFAGSLYIVWIKNRSAKKVKLLLNELDHRAKNNLQLLSAFFSLQSQSLENDIAIEAIKSSESRVNAMAIIHQKLYQNPEKRQIDMNEYITELTEYLQKSYGFTENSIQLKLDIEHLEMDISKAIIIGLILNELVTNAFKYAFGGGENSKLDIMLCGFGSKIKLVIQDNGPGMEKGFHNLDNQSFGLKMVQLLSKQLKAKLKIENTNGMRYELVA